MEILNGVKSRYEDHHKVDITEEAIKSAVTLAARFIPDRFLPDKAIDLIDEASSRVRLRGSVTPTPLKEAMEVLANVRKEKDEAIASQRYEAAAELRDRELHANEDMDNLEKEWHEDRGKLRPAVTEEGHRTGGQHVDRDPGGPAGSGRDGAPASHGRGPPQAHHRPRRGDP